MQVACVMPIVVKIANPHACRPDDAAGREKQYFWRVYDKARGDIAFIIDAKDVSRANWMRYVPDSIGKNMAR